MTLVPFLTPRFFIMKLASVGPCTESFGTTRKKYPRSAPEVRAGFVAEPDTNASPAFLRIGAAAETSWLPAGPITPMMLEFDANDCDTVEASEGVSWVSPWTMLIFSACVLFHSDAKNSAQWSWSSPIDATGPVNGPSMPIWIGFLHETVAGFAACDSAADVAVPASTSATAAHAPPTAIV